MLKDPRTLGVVTSDGMFWKQQLLRQLPKLEARIWAVSSSQPLLLLVFSPSISWAAPTWFPCQSGQKFIPSCFTSKEQSFINIFLNDFTSPFHCWADFSLLVESTVCFPLQCTAFHCGGLSNCRAWPVRHAGFSNYCFWAPGNRLSSCGSWP